MDKFENIVKQTRDLTLDTIMEAAQQALPEKYRDKPWALTNQGGSDENHTIYSEELQLDAYLASYTRWHKGKLQRAISLLGCPLPRQFNVIDWACGQGMATLFLLDYIKQNNRPCSINEVILIEPSDIALRRAQLLIHLMNKNIKIRCVNKMIDNLNPNDLAFTSSFPVYQMFSNILDIDGIHLKHLATILYANQSSYNTIICVSPFYYQGNIRIATFFNYFKRPRIELLTWTVFQR